MEPTPAAPPSPATAARFGRALLAEWSLDPAITYLNHGTVGVPPRRVLEAQRRIREEIERQPSRYLLRELSSTTVGMPRTAPPRLRVAAESVAAFVGARGADLVFVENATTGMNAVLRSFDLREGDEVLIDDQAYGAIRNAAGFHAGARSARVRVVELPSPARGPHAFTDAVLGAIGPRTRLCVMDHVTSESALVLPIADIARGCRERGVAIVVDGAHAPGALDLDVPAIGADYYVGNLHKWAHAPRSSAFLWARPELQAELHPPVISWGLGKGFTDEFDWVGTRDPSAFLAAPHGIDLLRQLGFAEARAYMHGLAWEAACLLTERWGVPLEVPESMVGTMVTVPLPPRAGASQEDAARLRDGLLEEDRIEVQLHAWKGKLWTRVSTQVYNDREDVLKLADAVLRRSGPRA